MLCEGNFLVFFSSGMAAYAALVSLAKTLEIFIQRGDRSSTLLSLNQKLLTLTEKSVGSFNSDIVSKLFSLSNALLIYIQQNQHEIDHSDKQHVASLQQRIVLFQEVFDKFPQRVVIWEAKVAFFANHVESVIELLSDGLGLEGVGIKDKDNLFLLTRKVGELFDLMFAGVKKDMDADDSSSPIKRPPGNLIHGKQRLFGFDHHLIEIRNRLLSHLSKVQIIPIIGMGGIGKTCLARALFDHPAVVNFCDLRRWVTVSQGYNVKTILLAILDDKSLDEMNTSIIDLGIRINRLLYGKRYLIVFDDIWDFSAWDEVQKFLRDDHNRSRVVLTTRHENVARYTKSTGFIQHLQLMNQETSWSLLKYRVFGEEEPCPTELVEIGQKIANGCKGLPLAIVVVAGILTSINLSYDSWEKLAKDVNEAIETSDDHFMDILALSYQHLPHYLRPCFLYMSAFPKRDYIPVSIILKLWVAEGFLKVNSKAKDIEDTAYEYLEELVKRNLIMTTNKRYNGRTKHFQLHDLLRDLCRRKAHEEMFFQPDEASAMTCRASFHSDESIQLISKQKLLHFRSALCFCNHNDLFAWLEGCRLLRVLDASRIPITSFPSQIMRFSHLRFLALTRTPAGVFEVPSSIYKLENLETLILKYHYGFHVESKSLIMPVEIWRLPKLRHLYLYPRSELLNPPMENISSLVNLQTLLKIRNLCCREDTIKMIPNLRKLVISYRIDPTKESWSDFYLNNLSHLSHLEYLRLNFNTQGYDLEWCKKNPLMKILTFPSSLKVLKFEGGAAQASWEDMTRILGSLPNLQVLKLTYFALSGDVWETNEDDFQKLRVLEICASYLKCWRSESSNPFPSLERLVLISCPYLIELPDGIGDIPTIESITVDDHQEAIVNWSKQIEQEQRDMGNSFLQVHVVKSAGLVEGDEPESKKAKLIKIWTDNAGDTGMMKLRFLSLFGEDIDGLIQMAESLFSELQMSKTQDGDNQAF